MKRFVIIMSLVVSAFSITSAAHGQVSVNVNIGTQPVWGPAGYDHVDYYYLPDIGVYYNVPAKKYVYRQGNNWVTRATLPPAYKNFDLYSNYKVVINERKPWLKDEEYRKKYDSFRNRHDQQVIRDSHDSKYFVIKEHPEHDKWAKEQRDKRHHH